ncbi:hypothetical protein MPER_01811 [Moniliophthora perniciosa FA553]|nr:hypothetical protein MPER_01811 [Moniliophthora perniciosa FA553]
MEPLILNAHDYDALPRMTLMVHPTIAIFLTTLLPLDPYHAPESLRQNVLYPLSKIIGAWPLWSHNRFKPERHRQRGSVPVESEMTCNCASCAQASSFESSSSGTYGSDFDSSDDGERVTLPVDEDPEGDCKAELDVAAWAGKVVLLPTYSELDDLVGDQLLRTYAQESALTPGQVKRALKEEDKKRNTLARPTLEDLRCRLSKKRSRRS